MYQSRTHPVVIVAALTVLVISAMGAAALTGVLPAASSKLEDPASIAARQAASGDLQRARAPAPQAAACTHCGMIESIRMIEVDVVTNGRGAPGVNASGRDGAVMTISSPGGGAHAGNVTETKVKKATVYRVTLRMDDGTYRTLSQPEAPRFAPGERARIAKGLVLKRE